MPNFWRFQNQTGSSAELLLYGDISDTSWWGDEVTPKQFAEELNALGAVSEITVRINSGGGDVFAAQTIGNLLESNTARVTAHIDGLCASAATIVACHCDRVIAAQDSIYMIHPVRIGNTGYLSADELRQLTEALAAIRETIIGLYVRKTGKDKDEVAAWMDATSWWTSEQARDNGFVDELTGTENNPVENRNGLLTIGGVNTHMPWDKAPKFVQDRIVAPADGHSGNINPKGESQKKEEKRMEIKTVDDLRNQYPDLVRQIEEAAATAATNAERKRIRDIEDMALPGQEQAANAAKFEQPISAGEYAINQAKAMKEQGSAWMNGAKKDAAQAAAVAASADTAAGAQKDEFLDALKNAGQAYKK